MPRVGMESVPSLPLPTPLTSTWAHILTLLLQPGPLLNEAYEGGNPSARAYHDDRCGGLEGQAELGLAHKHGHQGLAAVLPCGLLGPKPAGGHTLVDSARLGFIFHNHSTDVHRVGVDLEEGRSEINSGARGPILPPALSPELP